MNQPTNPATRSTTGIDDLPPEMICELFEYLQPKDLVVCSMVNRRWHSIYAGFKVQSLAIIDPEDPFNWHESNQPIRKVERCTWWMFCNLKEKPLLSNLKHLALRGDHLEFDLNKLNRFQQLVHLEIDTHLVGKVHLNLPRLEVLAIHHWNLRCSVSIDCPLLSTLLYAGEDEEDAILLKVKHPETIRKLETNMVGRHLAPFKNVRCLVTNQFEAINKATLLSLPALKELRFNRSIGSVFDVKPRQRVSTVDRVKRTLSEFMDEAKKLKGSDFQFTFAGLRLTNVNVEQIDFGVQVDESGRERVHNEYVYMKNYHLIESGALHFVRQVHYTRLLSNVTGEFPRCFFQKFTGIETVLVDGVVEDADQFLWFLKSLRFLRCLVLAKTGLGQEFYDQLPASARSLNRLDLRGGRENELQLNFDFIDRLSRLSLLYIEPVSFESVPSLVRMSGKLAKACFHVRLRAENVEMCKYSGKWIILKKGGSVFVGQNPDEVVNFIEGLQSNASERSSASD